MVERWVFPDQCRLCLSYVVVIERVCVSPERRISPQRVAGILLHIAQRNELGLAPLQVHSG